MAKKKAEAVTETVEISVEEKLQNEVDARIKVENLKGESFLFRKGTVLKIGETKITLTADSEVFFEGAKNEQWMSGVLAVSGNIEVNNVNFEANYNANGQVE